MADALNVSARPAYARIEPAKYGALPLRWMACLAFLSTMFASASVPAAAQTWPSRPIKLIVPFAAGGGTDTAGRTIAKGISELLGQSVVVENIGGAGGTLGSNAVAKAAPDGYTLGIATSSTHPSSVALMKNVPYDPVTSFSPVSLIGRTSYVLLASPSLGVSTTKEFVDYMKKHPEKALFGSVGVSSLGYLVTRQFLIDAGIELTHVPYKGSSQVYPDLISGQIAVFFDNPVASAELVKSRKLVALGTTIKTSLMPDAVVFAEQGYRNLETSFWYGIVAPAGTPPEIVDRIRAAVSAYVRSGEGTAALAIAGIEPVGSTKEQFRDTIIQDMAFARRLADSLGIKPE